jgi:cell wall-associated NlpC family hydrolase/3D (Asp-Asp-Asp) domain-containing protein
VKIKKVEDKPVVLHTKEETRLKLQKKKQTGKRKPVIYGHKSPLAKVKERKEKSAQSIKVRQHKIHAITAAGAKTLAKEAEGGEELCESVELLAVTSAPVVSAGQKASECYRRKKQQGKLKNKKREKYHRRSQSHVDDVCMAELERKKSAIKTRERAPTKKGRKKSDDSGKNRNVSGGGKLAATRMLETFLERFHLEQENEKTVLQSLAETVKAETALAIQKVAASLLPYVLGVVAVISTVVIIVVAYLVIIYNSPLAIFFPLPDTGYDNPRTVLTEYYKEFNEKVIQLEESGELITYQNTKNNVAVSNYNDTLMVYMILYGNGQAGYVMDEQGKKNLKKVFDEMNYISTDSSTSEVECGDEIGEVWVTAYCACVQCCGPNANGITASGKVAQAKHTIAVDAYNPIVPIGTKVIIEGIEYTVEDTGNLNHYGNDFDIFYDNHAACSTWGRRHVKAYLAEGNSNTVTVTTSGTIVHNLTYQDYIGKGTLSDEEEKLLTDMMDSDLWKEYYSSGIGQAVAELAMTKVGCHYSQDRRMEEGYYDCSSLVLRLYREVGIELPNVASTQGKYCYQNAMIINKEDLQPGDLIFYSYKKNGEFKNISHVAIYVGDGKMVHAANESRGVVIDTLRTGSVVFYARPYS